MGTATIIRHQPRVFQQPTMPAGMLDADLWVDSAHRRVWVHDGGRLRDLAPLVSVRSWGAVADGITSDTTAFYNAAAEAASRADGSMVLVDPGSYALASSVVLDGMGAVSVVGHGGASRILLTVGNGHNAFSGVTGVSGCRFQSLYFDGSSQAATIPTDTENGYGIYLIGDPYPVLEHLTGYRMNRALCMVQGATYVSASRIRGADTGFQQVDKTIVLNAGMSILHFRECAGGHVRDFICHDIALKRFLGITIVPRDMHANYPTSQDWTLDGIHGFNMGFNDPFNGGGCGLLGIYGSVLHGDLPVRCNVSNLTAHHVADSVVWFQGNALTLSNFTIQDVFYSGGIEFLGSQLIASDGVIEDTSGAGIIVWTGAFEPDGTGGQGNIDTVDVTLTRVKVKRVLGRSGFPPNGIQITNKARFTAAPPGGQLARIHLEDVSVDGTRGAGISVEYPTGPITASGRVSIKNTQKGALATTTLTAIAASAWPVLDVTSTANFVLAAYIALSDSDGTNVTATAYRVGAIGAGTITLVSATGGDPGAAPLHPYAVGAKLYEVNINVAALDIVGDPSLNVGFISFKGLDISDDQDGTTKVAVNVDGIRAPVQLGGVVTAIPTLLTLPNGSSAYFDADTILNGVKVGVATSRDGSDRAVVRDLHYNSDAMVATSINGVGLGEVNLRVLDNGVLGGWGTGNGITIGALTTSLLSAPVNLGDGTWKIVLSTPLLGDLPNGGTVTNTTKGNASTTSGVPSNATIITVVNAAAASLAVGANVWIELPNAANSRVQAITALVGNRVTLSPGMAVVHANGTSVMLSALTGVLEVYGHAWNQKDNSKAGLRIYRDSGSVAMRIDVFNSGGNVPLDGLQINNPYGIMVFKANGQPGWQQDMNGYLTPVADAVTDLGGTANRWRNAYLSGNLDAGGKSISGRTKVGHGTALVAGDFVLSAGWGTTGAVALVAGNNFDNKGGITITPNGTGIVANPSVTFTFHDGAFANVPTPTIGKGQGGGSPWTVSSISATQMVLLYNGTPTAGTAQTVYWGLVE